MLKDFTENYSNGLFCLYIKLFHCLELFSASFVLIAGFDYPLMFKLSGEGPLLCCC